MSFTLVKTICIIIVIFAVLWNIAIMHLYYRYRHSKINIPDKIEITFEIVKNDKAGKDDIPEKDNSESD